VDARFTQEDLERVAREAGEQGARAALARMAAPVSPLPPATAALPAWCSTAEYAMHIGKAPKTIREYARRAPPALVRKYGRDWRLAGPIFDAWVRAGGPFRVHEEAPEEPVH